MIPLLEILGLAIAVTAIAALARGRGSSSVVVGSAAVAGWLLIRFTGATFVQTEDGQFVLILASWAWIAVIAGHLKFAVGAGQKKPGSQWSCPACHYLNHPSSLLCEACRQPWRPKDQPGYNR